VSPSLSDFIYSLEEVKICNGREHQLFLKKVSEDSSERFEFFRKCSNVSEEILSEEDVSEEIQMFQKKSTCFKIIKFLLVNRIPMRHTNCMDSGKGFTRLPW
jgi:hypothetical protein